MSRNNKDSDFHNQYNRFENKVSRLFEDLLNDVGLSRTNSKGRRDSDGKPSWSPAIDVVENENVYIVTVDVPGVNKENLDVEFHDSVLVISGHNSQDGHGPQAQEINVDNQSRQPHQTTEPLQQQQSTEAQKYQQQPQPQQYQQPQSQSQQYQQQPQSQQYQQQPQSQQYQQQPQSQQYQQPPQQQQSTETQKHQNLGQKYNLSDEPQQQQSTGQQSNEPQQYQHINKHRHQPSQDKRFHVQERPYGYFSRSIQLPSNIKSDDEFYASLENGVLRIKVPKNNEKPRKKITIK